MPTNYGDIPAELRELKSWIVWRYEDKGGKKPTKVPYTKNGTLASVTNSEDWCSFQDALAIVDKYDGLGFVFSDADPYAFIDLDDTTVEIDMQRQMKVFNEFDSYSEVSPSGKGLHIIVKGSIPQGRKRSSIEIYSSSRYATMTGNVHGNKPIRDYHDLLNQLFIQMGGPPVTKIIDGNLPETESDEEIINKCASAANGHKFSELYAGNWARLYSSQSEADLAIIDIIAFYTQNRTQVARIFRGSGLGKRTKANRQDYVNWMIDKSFDRQLPQIDIDGFRIALEEKIAGSVNGKPTPFDGVNVGSNPSPVAIQWSDISLDVSPSGLRPAAHNGHIEGSNPSTSTTIQPPPGLMGDIARFIHEAAPRPVPEIAIAASIGLMAGICGKAYNISGTGLNQYVLLLAPTGTGKEAMASGIDKIINAVSMSVPVAHEFVGPGEIQSGQALIKNLSESPSYVSIMGEFGLRLRAMSSDKANGAEIALRRMLLDLYNKSGFGQVVRPTIYSDKAKNIAAISAPAFSILGESTPEKFYEVLTEEMISEGLLPRFMFVEYNGPRPALNDTAVNTQPSLVLIDSIANLMANAKTVMANRKVINVVADKEADKMLRDFDKYADSKINYTDRDTLKQLWNRAHMKALKISALIAVGCNIREPVINVDNVLWAKSIVENDIRALTKKFESGDIGKNNEEIKQIKDMKRMIKYFVTKEYHEIKANCRDKRLHSSKIIPSSFLSSRLYSMASFRNSKYGADTAFKKTLQNLVDSDFIREVPKKQMTDRFGSLAKAFVVSDMNFVDDD